MLERYGIVTRETVLAEGVPGGFSSLYGELSNLEMLGTARRGYFVEGLGGAQFALAGAVERLRSLPHAEGEYLLLAATDPAQPYGAALPWPKRDGGRRPARTPGRLRAAARRRPDPLRRARRQEHRPADRARGRAAGRGDLASWRRRGAGPLIRELGDRARRRRARVRLRARGGADRRRLLAPAPAVGGDRLARRLASAPQRCRCARSTRATFARCATWSWPTASGHW